MEFPFFQLSRMESNRILVTGFPVDATEFDLLIFFQSERDSGGGDVETVQLVYPGRAIIVFAEPEGNEHPMLFIQF